MIFKKNDLDFSLYLIKKGTVELINMEIERDDKNPIISIKKKKSILGMYSFFTGITNSYSARCVTECEIYKMDRDEFINILKENDTDFERFSSIKDDLLINNYAYALED